jgi:hypothetical protein
MFINKSHKHNLPTFHFLQSLKYLEIIPQHGLENLEEVVMTEGLLQEGHYQAKSRSCLLAQNMAMILPSHQVILWKAFSHIFHLLSIPSLMFIDQQNFKNQ